MAIRCRFERIAALAAALVLASCIGQEPKPLGPVGAQRMVLEGAACTAQGGQWVGAQGARTCVMPLPDAGKACRTSADCAGVCLARSGSCAPLRPLLGCNDIITSAGLRVRECVE